MVKVILTSAEGKKTDLLPENMSIRKVLETFGLCADAGRISIEGKHVEGEEMDKCLREFVANDMVHIAVSPAQPEPRFIPGCRFEHAAAPDLEEFPSGSAIHWTDKEFPDLTPEIRIAVLRNVIGNQTEALRKMLEELDRARKMLFDAIHESGKKEEAETELPF